MITSVRFATVGLSVLAVALVPVPAWSQLPDAVSDYLVESWTEKDGLPSTRVWALAQDPQGYLWLGTATGLVRFDGARFVSMDDFNGTQLPKTEVYALLAASDGSLWASFGVGGTARIQGSSVVMYRSGSFGQDFALSLAEDDSGDIWAGGFTGLYRFRHGTWVQWGPSRGVPDGEARVVSLPSGALVATVAGETFQLTERRTFTKVTLPAPAGAGAFERVSVRADATTVFRDRRGGLWVRTGTGGLWHLDERAKASRSEPSPERFLPGLSILSTLVDRDDNVWVGTTIGLHRISRRRVTSFAGPGQANAVASGPDGSVWVGGRNAVMRVSVPGREGPSGTSPSTTDSRVLALHVDAAGLVWAGTATGLFRLGDEGLTRVPGSEQMKRISVISSTPDGTVWVSDLNQGVYRVRDGVLELLSLQPGDFSPAYAMHADTTGRVWVGFAGGRLGVRHPDGTFQTFQSDDDTDLFRFAYQDGDDRLWLAGSNGLTRFDRGTFVTLRREHGFPWAGLSGIVEDADGFLWLGVNSGIVRLHPREVDRVAADPGYRVVSRFFDSSDGLAGAPIWLSNPSAAADAEGRLWFVTGRGLTVIDPAALGAPPPSPPVLIESVLVDDRPVVPTPQVTLPPNLGRVEIAYTAVSLSSATKLRFRYWLDGFDDDWVEAGNRRQAVYTNLAPGDYRFRVSVADGMWTERDAAWSFSIAPRFYETAWFLAAGIAAVGLAIAGAWLARMRIVKRRFAVVLDERSRMSREIHDTLLQGMIGMALQLDAVTTDAERVDEGLNARLTRLREHLEQQIREVRRSVWDLRSPTLELVELAAALKATGAQATANTSLGFDFQVVGTPRRLAPKCEEQILRVGGEAILNILRHAQAHAIRMRLEYDDHSLRLRVSDDGRGFDPDRAAPGLGLQGMRERIRSIGGTLEVTTAPGRGTTIEAVVRCR